MKATQFCYWLQGYLEISKANDEGVVLTEDQIDCIQKHLALVFQHDINPKAGGKAKQAALNAVHNPGYNPHKPVMRC